MGEPGHRVNLVNGLLSWWDGIELWLSGLAFVLQALVVMPAAGQGHPADALPAPRRRGVRVIGMPRSRVTLVLVTLIVLVIVTWLLTH
jgi:hypothetical protein